MVSLFRNRPKTREIYFHEDDYCQQQILPATAKPSVIEELQNISEFSEAHRAPDSVGWTNVYVRDENGPGFGSLGIQEDQLDATFKDHLPRFDRVLTGYSSHRAPCPRTGAWGTSESCCIFADWNETKVVQNIWTSLFDSEEDSLLRSALAISALARLCPLIFVDWAWDYTCDAGNQDEFIRLLRGKLHDIARNTKERKNG